MSSRKQIIQTVSTTEPVGAALGDEWFNPTTNKLYKRMIYGGVVGWTEIPLTVNSATSISFAGGSANQILYQTTANQTNFVTAPVTGSTFLRWTGSAFDWSNTIASSAAVVTVARTSTATHFLTFVDSNNASNIAEAVYTTSSFSINPATGEVTATGILTALELKQTSSQISIGNESGFINRGAGVTSIGYRAGYSTQTAFAVAVGYQAGSFSQGSNAVSVGYLAGETNQGNNSVALGTGAGRNNQRTQSIAIGNSAASTNQSTGSIAIGFLAGQTNQSQYAIAIGYGAGGTNQPANSIVLNADVNGLNVANASSFYVNPIRADSSTSATTWGLYYNPVTKEITTSTAGGLSSTATNANNIATIAQTANAAYYPAFVDTNNATSAYELLYTTSSFVINPSTGNVGIGTTSPSVKLDITGDQVWQRGYGAGSTPYYRLFRYLGTSAAPTIVTTGTTLGGYDFVGYDGATPWSGASITAVVVGGVATNSMPASLVFSTNPGTTFTTERMRINSSGTVQILSTATAISTTTGALQVVGGVGIGGNLYVGGEIVAQKLTIQLTTVTTTLIETDDIIKTTNVTQATATATGALQIAGGASVGGNLWVGGTILGNFGSSVSTATNANNIATVQQTASANYNLTFVDSNDASATYNAVYTTSTLFVNPANGTLYASSFASSGIVAGLGYTPTRTALSTATNSVISADTRAANYTPSDRPAGLYVDFKQNTTDGLADGGTYHGVLTFRSYGSGSDLSGGQAQQIAYTDNNNLWHRISNSTTTWATWIKVLDTGNSSTAHVGFADDAFNIFGGAAGRIPIQSAAGTTSFLPAGSSGNLLQYGTNTATWVTTSSLHVGTANLAASATSAGSATNLAGGAAGRIPIQSAAGTTSFIPTGSNGQVLTWSGSTATWAAAPGATTINTQASTTNTGYYLTFVDANNASATGESLYTTSSFTINPSTGNVGIGTASPTGKLDVVGTGGTVRISTTGASINFTNNGVNYFTANAASASIYHESNTQVFRNGVGTTTYLGLSSSGVAVGRATSVKKFDVVGDALFTATSVPTSDIVTISNQGFPVATAGANALQVTYVGGNGAIEASAVRADMTPGTTSSSVWSAFRVASTTAAGTGVTFNGVKFDSKTAGAGTSNALWVGTGYDNILNYNGTVVINGSGQVIAAQILGAVSSATNSTNSTNLLGGATGSIPYQSAAGTTRFIPIGSNGQVLTSNGTTATWANASGATVETTARSTNAVHYLTFVADNNVSAAAETVYTTSTFTINPSNGNVVIPGQLTAGGTIVSGQGVSTGDAAIELGGNRTGAGPAYVDFHSTASTDFEARIIRYAGVNGGMDIINNGTGGMVLSVEGSGSMAFKTAATDRMRIDNSGNVNIGSSAATAAAGIRYFDVYNTENTSGSSAADIRLVTQNAAGSGTIAVDLIKYKSGAFYISNAETSSTGMIGFSIGNTERVRIDSSGNVGIGTSSPQSKFHVQNTSDGEIFRVQRAGGTNIPIIRINLSEANNVGTFEATGAVAPAMAFTTAGVERMRIDSSGNVGIGTTTPGSTLEVAGGIRARGGAPGANGVNNNGYAFNGNSGDNDSGMFSSADGQLDFYTNAALAMRISSGNVGIGTSSPSSLLNVYDAGNSVIKVSGNATSDFVAERSSSDAASSNLMFYKSRGTIAARTAVSSGDSIGKVLFTAYGGTTFRGVASIEAIVSTFTADNNISSELIFSTSPTGSSSGQERMRIGPSGNVGINNSSPGQRLSVRTAGRGTDGIIVDSAAAGNPWLRIIPDASSGSYNGITQAGDALIAFSSGTVETGALSIAPWSAGTSGIRILANGNVGIGTTSPKTRLQATAGTNLNAPSLGSATNAPFYVTNTDPSYGLLVGSNASDGHTWLQAQRTDGTATAYNITLNEAGGNVGIGVTSVAGGRLQISGATSDTNGVGLDQGQLLITDSDNNTTSGLMLGYRWQSGVAEYGRIQARNAVGATDIAIQPGGGKVGIGTSSPNYLLDVSGNAAFGSTIVTGNGVSTADTAIELGGNRTGNGASYIDFHAVASTDYEARAVRYGGANGSLEIINNGTGDFNLKATGAANMRFYTSNAQQVLLESNGTFTLAGLLVTRASAATDVNSANDTGSLSIRGSSTTVASISFHRPSTYAINMGLGTDNVFRIGGWSASSNAFQMSGGGDLTMLGNVTAYSDARIKKDVETIEGALDLVSRMRGVRYTRTDTEKRGVGVIAQEMLEVIPEVVQQGVGDDDTLSVAYGNLVGVLIEAIKEQQKQIDELKYMISEIKKG